MPENNPPPALLSASSSTSPASASFVYPVRSLLTSIQPAAPISRSQSTDNVDTSSPHKSQSHDIRLSRLKQETDSSDTSKDRHSSALSLGEGLREATAFTFPGQSSEVLVQTAEGLNEAPGSAQSRRTTLSFSHLSQPPVQSVPASSCRFPPTPPPNISNSTNSSDSKRRQGGKMTSPNYRHFPAEEGDPSVPRVFSTANPIESSSFDGPKPEPKSQSKGLEYLPMPLPLVASPTLAASSVSLLPTASPHVSAPPSTSLPPLIEGPNSITLAVAQHPSNHSFHEHPQCDDHTNTAARSVERWKTQSSFSLSPEISPSPEPVNVTGTSEDSPPPEIMDEVPDLPFNLSQYGLVHLPPLPSPSSSERLTGSGVSSRQPSLYTRGRLVHGPESISSDRSLTGGSDSSKYYSAVGSSSVASKDVSLGERGYSQIGPNGSGFTSGHTTSSLSSSIDGARSKGDPNKEMRPETFSSSESGSGGEEYVNFRFQHAMDEHGNHVVIGREGKLEKCEDEPIRTPGAVQGFGVLVAVEDREEVLVVHQVSENSTEILGLSPRYLFSLECFTDTLPENSAGALWDNIQFLTDPNFLVSEDEDASPHIFVLNGWGEPGSASNSRDPDEAGLPVPPQAETKRQWSCWCAVHRTQSSNGSKPGLIILEFELESDNLNPLYPHVPAFSLHSPENASRRFGSSSTLVSSPNVSSPSSTVISDESSYSAAGSSARSSSPSNAPSTTAAPQAATRSSTWSQYTPHSLAGLEGQDDWIPSAEDIFESTTSYAKPLPALERLRRITQRGPSPYGPSTFSKSPSTPSFSGSTPLTSPTSSKSTRTRRRGSTSTTPVGMMDVFAVMAQINEQLATAQDLDIFLKVTVGIIKDLTQFHRVLVYQFDEVWNGQAVAELVDWGVTKDLYRGLHFPATDIPKQARDLYMINKVRVLYDRSQPTARIVVRDKTDLEEPLDMTHCYLRAMSPIHIQYLGNMGVRASMSVSVMAFDQLWGLVTCHSYGNAGMRVSFPVRQMLRLLSQSISRNIERLSYTKRLHTRKLINTLVSDYHPAGYIISNTDDLLGLFDADFGILVIGDGAKILGPNQHGQEILIMAEYLRLKQFDTIQASQAVIDDFPDLQLTTGFEVIAGLLYVPLSSEGKDFIAFLRRGQLRDVHWAGKPFKSASRDAQANLEPRKSFKIWSETVAGRCRVWTDEQLETAGVLALVYGKFIEVWRQRQNALQATKLTNLLLSNATHEVRTPLNHIINYLEMAMNGPLDNETRDNLVRSHAASKSLLFTINDLLDLTRLESGNEISFHEPFDLHMTIEDAVHIYRQEASRRDLQFNLDISESPQNVIGDSRKIRTVAQNLTANALKYTETGSISVSCKIFGEPEGLRSPKQTVVEIVVADTGCGMQEEKLENIFREFEQVESSEPRSNAEAGVGLGLAVVARIVEQLGGQLRVESRVGAGSRFSFLIPLALFLEGSDSPVSSRSSGGSSAQSRAYSRASSLPPSRHNEIDGLIGALSSNQMPPCPPPTREGPAPAAGAGSASASKMVNRGTFDVKDSRVPIRPVKVDYYDQEVTRANRSPRASSENTQERAPPARIARRVSQAATAKREKLRILIVEDNDINRAILAKRLGVMGHVVVNATNGQEGIDIVKSDNGFDVVLMDIQMPIVDGFEATRKIRALETGLNEIGADSTSTLLPTTTPSSSAYCESSASPASSYRLSHELNGGRMPVFAVSASLMEQQRGELINCGMDGWILKPIDFKRLNVILKGVTDVEQKKRDIYQVGGNWEVGGWLVDRTSGAQ